MSSFLRTRVRLPPPPPALTFALINVMCYNTSGDRMPRKLKTPCKFPRCPNLCEPGESYCAVHKRLHRQRQDKKRGTAHQRGYSSRWREARRLFLQENPLCVECLKQGVATPATVVDHIIPHRGDWELFWDRNNWQSLCKRHHDAKTARECFAKRGRAP